MTKCDDHESSPAEAGVDPASDQCDWAAILERLRQVESLVVQTQRQADDGSDSQPAKPPQRELDELCELIDDLSGQLDQANTELGELRESNQALTARISQVEQECLELACNDNNQTQLQSFAAIRNELGAAEELISETRARYDQAFADLIESRGHASTSRASESDRTDAARRRPRDNKSDSSDSASAWQHSSDSAISWDSDSSQSESFDDDQPSDLSWQSLSNDAEFANQYQLSDQADDASSSSSGAQWGSLSNSTREEDFGADQEMDDRRLTETMPFSEIKSPGFSPPEEDATLYMSDRVRKAVWALHPDAGAAPIDSQPAFRQATSSLGSDITRSDTSDGSSDDFGLPSIDHSDDHSAIPSHSNETIADADSSVEDYISDLLTRVKLRRDSDAPVSAALSQLLSRSSSDADQSIEEAAKAMFDQDGQLTPRSLAPESVIGLAAMRDLANASARSAIASSVHKHTRERRKDARLQFLCAAAAVLCGVTLYLNVDALARNLAITLIVVVAGLFAREGIRSLIEARRRQKAAHQAEDQSSDGPADEPEQVAQETTEPEQVATDLDQTELDQTKVDQTTLDETTLDETKVDQTKVDQTKVDQTKVDETKVDETSLDESVLDESALDESALDESALDESALDESALDESCNPGVAETDSEQLEPVEQATDEPETNQQQTIQPSASGVLDEIAAADEDSDARSV